MQNSRKFELIGLILFEIVYFRGHPTKHDT